MLEALWSLARMCPECIYQCYLALRACRLQPPKHEGLLGAGQIFRWRCKYQQGTFTGFPETSLPIYKSKRNCCLQGSSENMTWMMVRREDACLNFTLAQVYTTGQIHANQAPLCLWDVQRPAFLQGTITAPLASIPLVQLPVLMVLGLWFSNL